MADVATPTPNGETSLKADSSANICHYKYKIQIQIQNAQIVECSILSPIYSFTSEKKILRIQWMKITNVMLARPPQGKLDISRLPEEGGLASKHCMGFIHRWRWYFFFAD